MEPNALCSRYFRSFCGQELLHEMLLQCAQLGRQEKGHWWSSRRCPSDVVQLIFDLSTWLQIGHQEKYAAVELFERFSEIHVKSVRSELCEKGCSPDTRRQTRGNLQKQVVLRLVSCIIIVHKYHNSNSRSHRMIRDFIAKCLSLVKIVAPKCTHEILIKSEFRVLQTIDFRVEKPMPLPYLQIMIEVVLFNRPGILSEHLTCLIYLVCDCYYLHRQDIHTKMRSMDGSDEVKDYVLLLSTAMIATTAFICLDGRKRELMNEELAFITAIPMKYILDLRDCFLLIICERRNPFP